MEEREIVVAACDLDKTLYPPHGPSQATQLMANVAAMERFEKAGCFGIPVTGNNLMLAQRKFMNPDDPKELLRDISRHPGIFTNGGLVLGPDGAEIERHALGNLILNGDEDGLDFISKLLDVFDASSMKETLNNVGLCILTPDKVIGYDRAFSNVEGYAKMMQVEATKCNREEIIDAKGEALQIVLLWPPLSPAIQKQEYETRVRPLQDSAVAKMREYGLFECSYPAEKQIDGLGAGVKIICMKDPWPEVDFNVAGVDKGKALCRFLQHGDVLKLLGKSSIDVSTQLAVFGDAGNDVPMFLAIDGEKQAGFRVAMPHADNSELIKLATRRAEVSVVLNEIVDAKMANPDELLRLRFDKIDRRREETEETMGYLETSLNWLEYDMRKKDAKTTINFSAVGSCDVASLGDSVIHFKGFGKKIDFSDACTSAWRELTLKEMEALRPTTVVWDGDSYHEDSFTQLIPDMYRSLKPTPRLVMFLRDSQNDMTRVLNSWSWVDFGSKLSIDCYLVDAGITFDKLGLVALSVTQSKQVLAFGGGVVVEKEFDDKPQTVSYTLVAVKRGEELAALAREKYSKAEGLKILELQ